MSEPHQPDEPNQLDVTQLEEVERLLAFVQSVQRAIRDAIVEACTRQSVEELSRVVNQSESKDDTGDTLFAIDRISEALLVQHFEARARDFGGIVLVAEGLDGGEVTLPRGTPPESARFRVVVDPIDGTRGIMYQKRSAWVLSAVAYNRGAQSRLAQVLAAAQTEIPTLKQHLSDELWAVRGQGARATRYDRLRGEHAPLSLRPSTASSIAQGYAMLSRFFPGARDVLAALDDDLAHRVLGPSPNGKALCFEDQYACTGGQLYELASGHDRFNADLRPLCAPLLERRGLGLGLCCHPYDICTALIAQELGVILTDPWGKPLDAPLNVHADVAWVGYANRDVQRQVEPVLQELLRKWGLG